MKAHILATFVGIAAFAGFSPYIPGEVFEGSWGNTRDYSVADVTEAHVQANVDKGITFFRMHALGDEDAGIKPAIDVSKLVKIDGHLYDISHDDSVSLVPVSSSVIRKVGYGRATDVHIIQTSSGTYSTDGLASNHVLYPGINAEHVADLDHWWGSYYWVRGAGWMGVSLRGGNSFVHYGKSASGGRYITNGNRNCFSGKGYFGCN